MVNRERKRRKWVNEEIEMGEWDNYFRELLGGVEWRVVRGIGGNREGDGEEGLSRKEVREVIRKLKDGKAVGGDGIPNEVWKYGGEELEEAIRGLCSRVWRGKEWPKEWREGVLVPVEKKGRGEKVGDYRRVTLTQTALLPRNWMKFWSEL